MSLVNKILSAKQVQQWKNQGYVLASGLISDKLVASAQEYLSKKYYNTQTVCQGFGSHNGEFPFLYCFRTKLRYMKLLLSRCKFY